MDYSGGFTSSFPPNQTSIIIQFNESSDEDTLERINTEQGANSSSLACSNSASKSATSNIIKSHSSISSQLSVHGTTSNPIHSTTNERSTITDSMSPPNFTAESPFDNSPVQSTQPLMSAADVEKPFKVDICVIVCHCWFPFWTTYYRLFSVIHRLLSCPSLLSYTSFLSALETIASVFYSSKHHQIPMF